MDLLEYFDARRRECERMSLAECIDYPLEGLILDHDATLGRLLGRVYLDESAYIEISERLEARDTHVYRVQYAYFLVVNDQERCGLERDPTHDPVEHGHVGPEHERVTAGRVSFLEAVDLAWGYLSDAAA